MSTCEWSEVIWTPEIYNMKIRFQNLRAERHTFIYSTMAKVTSV